MARCLSGTSTRNRTASKTLTGNSKCGAETLKKKFESNDVLQTSLIDACCSPFRVDALNSWRALLESFGKAQDRLRELVRHSLANVSPIQCGRTCPHSCLVRLEERDRCWVILPNQKSPASDEVGQLFSPFPKKS